MKNNSVLSAVLMAWAGLMVCPSITWGDVSVDMKGYYIENGAFVRQRLLDPLEIDAQAPLLPADLKERKKVLTRYFEGRTVVSKISLPAVRVGVIFNPDSPSSANVDLYGLINKHGSAMKKGEKGLITRFRIQKKFIDVDLNGGGYGNAGDVTVRVVSDVMTLGLRELGNDNEARSRRGSRVRVLFKGGRKDGFSSLDIRREALLAAVEKGGRPADTLLASLLGLSPDSNKSPTAFEIAQVLDNVLDRPDFPKLADAHQLALPKRSVRQLKKLNASARKSKRTRRRLSVDNQRRLNHTILEALYPEGIRRGSGQWSADQLTVEGVQSLLFPILGF